MRSVICLVYSLSCALAVAAPADDVVALSKGSGWFNRPPAEAGLAIFTEADDRQSGFGDVEVELQMILKSMGGSEAQRSLRIKQLEVPDDGDKLLIVFDTPKTIRGTALLSYSHKTVPDDQWLYLPSFKRVKKIASRDKSGPFLSSEFSFEDLASQELEKFTYRFDHETLLNDQPCLVVERVPVESYSGYSRQLVWLDANELRIQRIEYYARNGELMKTLTVDGYELYLGTYWKAERMLMLNHQTGRSTELVWSGYAFQQGLSDDRDFSVASLRRAR